MKIYLFCSGGMSTTLLVSKMTKLATERGLDVHIEAFGEAKAKTLGPEADIILLAPQIKFREKAIRTTLPDKFIQLIDMRAYGTVNGEAVLDAALAGYEEFKK